jgi:arylformamidase
MNFTSSRYLCSMSRLITMAVISTSLLCTPARAQQGEKEFDLQEASVFLDYTQEELDNAYDQSIWAPNAKEIVKSWTVRSIETKERYDRGTYRYGPSEAEVLDIFRSDQANAPTLIFIHGGAWRAGSKDDYSLLADSFVPYGANLIVVNFDNIPDERITGMVDQVRTSLSWIYENAIALGVDSEKMYLAGHSSGGHLVGVMMTTDWTEHDLPANIIKGGLSISGLFDLEPVLLSSRSNYVELDEAEQSMLSPMRHLDQIRAPIVLAYGGKETPEFQRHSREFGEALQQTPYQSGLIFLPDLNHFEMLNSMADPHGEIANAARKMMGLIAQEG